MVHPLKNTLNKLRWTTGEHPEHYIITYRHRGAPEDRKEIFASNILRLGKSYFTLKGGVGEDEVLIPYHRILEIRNIKDGSLLWISRRG